VKDFKLPKVQAGLSPKQVANQRWGVLKDIKELDHQKALKGGSGIGWKNPLSK
jgi:hypothetical protein